MTENANAKKKCKYNMQLTAEKKGASETKSTVQNGSKISSNAFGARSKPSFQGIKYTGSYQREKMQKKMKGSGEKKMQKNADRQQNGPKCKKKGGGAYLALSQKMAQNAKGEKHAFVYLVPPPCCCCCKAPTFSETGGQRPALLSLASKTEQAPEEVIELNFNRTAVGIRRQFRSSQILLMDAPTSEKNEQRVVEDQYQWSFPTRLFLCRRAFFFFTKAYGWRHCFQKKCGENIHSSKNVPSCLL